MRHYPLVQPRYAREPDSIPGPFYVAADSCIVCALPPKAARARQTIAEVVRDALADPDNRDFVDYADLTTEELAQIAARTADDRSLVGYKRSLSASDVQHTVNGHRTDPIPVKPADIERLPELLKNPIRQAWETQRGGLDVLVSIVKDGSKMRIVEEMRTGRKRLAFKSMYYL